ncbi:hypothetical protein KAX08_05690, partial [candidate division WOR-3 bacterium]|nr:hypothetical protein [candidate division WOR-3 bacterium]
MKRFTIICLIKKEVIKMGSTPKDPELLEIPGTEGTEGEPNLTIDFLLDLMNAGAPKKGVAEAMKVPLQQIAGMSANERLTQSLLSKYLGTSATEGE